MDAVETLSILLEGNRRFVNGMVDSPRRGAARRKELAGGQDPIAIVLSCSDSRVVPEFIFDQGIGDLFVVRVAGNILDDVVLGSIEYAASHLSTPLIVVLGHTCCGAVTATVSGGKPEGHTGSFIQEIVPTMKRCCSSDIDEVARENARDLASSLASSEPILADLVKKGGLSVRAAFYDIVSGEVDLLD